MDPSGDAGNGGTEPLSGSLVGPPVAAAGGGSTRPVSNWIALVLAPAAAAAEDAAEEDAADEDAAEEDAADSARSHSHFLRQLHLTRSQSHSIG